MKPRKHVRLPMDILRSRLVRKSKTGLIIHWIMLKLGEHHGYIPLQEDGRFDPFDPETIADDLGYTVGSLAGRESIIDHICHAIKRAKDHGLLIEGQKTVNTGGRYGGSTMVVKGWTSPLYEQAQPRKPKKVGKQNERLQRKGSLSTGNYSTNPVSRARGLTHTQNSKLKSDPPGRDQWSR